MVRVIMSTHVTQHFLALSVVLWPPLQSAAPVRRLAKSSACTRVPHQLHNDLHSLCHLLPALFLLWPGLAGFDTAANPVF